MAAATFSALWGLALLRHWTLLGSYDMGYFTQASWLLRSGHEPFVTVRGIHLLGDHGSLVFYPMAYTFGWLGAPGLLALQALALAAGVVPLWLLARRAAGLSVGVSTGLVCAYALYPAVSNVSLFDFHPEAVVAPALLGAVWFLHRGGPWWAYGLCLALVLGSREDVAVTVVFLGVYGAWVVGRRVAGAVTAVVGVVWLGVQLGVVLPHFAGGDYVQANRFAQYGDTLGSAAAYMAGHPFEVLGDFATKPNLYVLVGLLAPLLFLPLLAPRHLFPGLPLQLAYLLTNVAAAHTITAQYTVTTIPFMFVAAAFALAKVGDRVPKVSLALPAAALAGFLVFGTASPRHEPWEWAVRDRVDRARLAAADLVPDDAAVSATVRMWPLLAERRDLYEFPRPLERYQPQSDDPKPAAARTRELRWIVLDTADRQQWTGAEASARERLLAPGNPDGWHVAYERFGIVVYRR